SEGNERERDHPGKDGRTKHGPGHEASLRPGPPPPRPFPSPAALKGCEPELWYYGAGRRWVWRMRRHPRRPFARSRSVRGGCRPKGGLGMRAFRVVGIVVLFLSLGLSAPAASSEMSVDWPQFRFDDRHTGVNPLETTISKENVQFLSLSWQAQLGDI